MIIVHCITSLEIGGAQAVLYDTTTYLQRYGYQNHIVYFADGPYKERFVKAGISVHHVTGAVCTYDPVWWYRLYQCIKDIHSDVIHGCLWSANLVTRLVGYALNIPVINALHNKRDHNGWIRQVIDRGSLWLPHTPVAVSQDVKISFEPLYGARAHDITVINNGVDTGAVRTKAQHARVLRHDLTIPDDAFVIGAVGRLVPVKNYPTLIRYFSEYARTNAHAYLVIVGSGPCEQELRACATNSGVGARIVFVTDAVAYGYYPLFDCLTLLATSDAGVSLVLLEAMCLNVPVVVHSFEGNHALIEHQKTGYVVNAENGESVTQAWIACATEKEKNAYMVRCAKRLVEQKYGVESTVFQYRLLCEDLVHSKVSKKAL